MLTKSMMDFLDKNASVAYARMIEQDLPDINFIRLANDLGYYDPLEATKAEEDRYSAVVIGYLMPKQGKVKVLAALDNRDGAIPKDEFKAMFVSLRARLSLSHKLGSVVRLFDKTVYERELEKKIDGEEAMSLLLTLNDAVEAMDGTTKENEALVDRYRALMKTGAPND